MKYAFLVLVLALSNSVFSEAPTVKKKVTHDKEHHHEGPADHEHDEAHHKDHDHLKHHPEHDTAEDKHVKKVEIKKK